MMRRRARICEDEDLSSGLGTTYFVAQGKFPYESVDYRHLQQYVLDLFHDSVQEVSGLLS